MHTLVPAAIPCAPPAGAGRPPPHLGARSRPTDGFGPTPPSPGHRTHAPVSAATHPRPARESAAPASRPRPTDGPAVRPPAPDDRPPAPARR